jgi:hypothetical protein
MSQGDGSRDRLEPTTARALKPDKEEAFAAGPPPYGVYEVTPTTAFAFPLDPTVTPTRWRFASS